MCAFYVDFVERPNLLEERRAYKNIMRNVAKKAKIGSIILVGNPDFLKNWQNITRNSEKNVLAVNGAASMYINSVVSLHQLLYFWIYLGPPIEIFRKSWK